MAVAEMVFALMAVKYLEARAARGARLKFYEVLAKVPAIEPEAFNK